MVLKHVQLGTGGGGEDEISAIAGTGMDAMLQVAVFYPLWNAVVRDLRAMDYNDTNLVRPWPCLSVSCRWYLACQQVCAY